MGIMSAGQAYSSAASQKAQSDFTAGQYSANQKIATEQASEAKSAGDLEAGQMAEQTKMNVAKQRVAGASTGADVNSGSALALQTDTNWQGQQNEVMIRNNAWKTAWGLNVEASNYGSQSQFATIAGNAQFNNTLLTGGMNAAAFGFKANNTYNNYNGGGWSSSDWAAYDNYMP